MSHDRILLTPAPDHVAANQARHAARLGFMGCRVQRRHCRVRKSLLAVVHGEQTHVVVPLQGSGTFSVEAAVATVVAPRWPRGVLVLDNGAYCKRAAKLTTMMDRRCTVMPFADHEPVSPSATRDKLEADASITHVVLIHCETGAGVLNPLPEIADVCAAAGKAHHRCHELVRSH